MGTKETTQKKVSFNVIKEIIKFERQNPVVFKYSYGEFDDKELEIEVKQHLSISDKANFVREVADGCFNGDKYEGYFRSELFKIAVLKFFTNLKADSNVEVLFDLINCTNVYQSVLEQIPSDVIQELNISIDGLVNWKQQESLNTQKQLLDEALEQIASCINVFHAIDKSFKGIDKNKILKVYNKFANANPRDLADAVLAIEKEEKAKAGDTSEDSIDKNSDND